MEFGLMSVKVNGELLALVDVVFAVRRRCRTKTGRRSAVASDTTASAYVASHPTDTAADDHNDNDDKEQDVEAVPER